MTGSKPANSCSTNKPTPQILEQLPATTDTIRAIALVGHMTSTAEHVDPDDTKGQGDADAVRQELAEMRERMAVIKHEVTRRGRP